MQALTTKQQQLIVSNVIKACGDIEKLNSTGYKFLNLCSGFIAHYDINGFKAYYSENSLIDDIERNASSNQWGNFNQGNKDYEYYMSIKAVYNAILGFFAACEYQATYGG
jgi:hypothetical protein